MPSGTRVGGDLNPPIELAGYSQWSLRDPVRERRLRHVTSPAVGVSGTLVLVPNPVPICANPDFFPVSHFEICSYIEEAQRFPATTDLN